MLKVLLFLLGFTILNAYEYKSAEQPNETVMQQDNILAWVEKNDISAVTRALNNGANVNTRDRNKRSLLLIATINQQVEMAKLLVAHGADVNLQDDKMDSLFL